MEALSPNMAAKEQVVACAPEQSLLVACLLSMSGGFIDAFAWLSLGGVFANSQTGNVVFVGVYAASGQWFQALHHLPPILAFVAGAWVATTVRAPLLCLAGEIVSLTLVMLLLHRLAEPVAVTGVAFGVALQTASFRQIERWKYLSVTVTGNTLRAIDLLVTNPDREAVRGGKVILTICLMFLLGAAVGELATRLLAARGLIFPIGLLTFALAICGRYCRHRWQT
ncbi:YoaK family protein [Bradyrhizobium diazoefficiens]